MSLLQMLMIIMLVVAAAESQAVVGGKAQSAECQTVINELKAMKLAQKTLLESMVQNNETMASTLDRYAADLQQSAKTKKPVSAQDLNSLKRSAEAFRQHKSREGKLVSTFDTASDRLFVRVQSCLNK